jgi:UDP-N-acetylglucosamine enolpyruvyl transferase
LQNAWNYLRWIISKLLIQSQIQTKKLPHLQDIKKLGTLDN